MSQTKPPLPRRRFIQLIAASGAAIAAGAAPRPKAMASAGEAPPPRRGRESLPAAMRQELRNQEKTVADALQAVRSYELPPGSEPATVFRAMRSRKRERR